MGIGEQIAELKTHISGQNLDRRNEALTKLEKLAASSYEKNEREVSVAVLEPSLLEMLVSILSSKFSPLEVKNALGSLNTIFKITWASLVLIEPYLPVFRFLSENLNKVDSFGEILHWQSESLKVEVILFIDCLLEVAIRFKFDGIIPISERLGAVGFFNAVNEQTSTHEVPQKATQKFKDTFLNYLVFLSDFHIDLSKDNQNSEYLGVIASLEKFFKGIPIDNEKVSGSKTLILNDFSLLSLVSLEIFLKNKKHFFRDNILESVVTGETDFPVCAFFNALTKIWLTTFLEEKLNLCTLVLEWDTLMYHSMLQCLNFWKDFHALSKKDIDRLLRLFLNTQRMLEDELKIKGSLEHCIYIFSVPSVYLRDKQIEAKKKKKEETFSSVFTEFDNRLRKEVFDFVCEQRVTQMLKGTWVYSEEYGNAILKNNVGGEKNSVNHYFIMLSPNLQEIYHKEFKEKPLVNPSFEEMSSKSFKLSSIKDFQAISLGGALKGSDKLRVQNFSLRMAHVIGYERLIFVDDKGAKLLSFYSGNEVNKSVWFDGLKMLKGIKSSSELTKTTSDQLTTLFQMRKNNQLLKLGQLRRDIFDQRGSDNDMYDINSLNEALADPFYYESV